MGAATTLPVPATTTTFTYSCSGLSTTTYTLTATGTGTARSAFVYTINQTNTKATTAAPTGWAAATMPASCWITQERRRVLMKTFPKAKSAGFTLIELMIAVTVLVRPGEVGFPSFQQMLRNSEIRVAAESVANGLQRARAEAVSRNAKVQFVLGAGTSWTVDYVPRRIPTPPLDSRASTEGSANATITALWQRTAPLRPPSRSTSWGRWWPMRMLLPASRASQLERSGRQPGPAGHDRRGRQCPSVRSQPASAPRYAQC